MLTCSPRATSQVKVGWTLLNQLAGMEHLRPPASTVLFGKPKSSPLSRVEAAERAHTHLINEGFVEASVVADESKGWKTNDRIIIRVDMTVYGDAASTTEVDEGSLAPPSTLSRDMHAVLSSLPWYGGRARRGRAKRGRAKRGRAKRGRAK